MKVQSRVNFTKVLRGAFTGEDPKSAKDIDDLTVFLRFWHQQSARVKASHEMLVRSTPGGSFGCKMESLEYTVRYQAQPI